MLKSLYDSCSETSKKKPKLPSSKRQKLESECNSSKAQMKAKTFAEAVRMCIKTAIESTKFAKLTEDQEYEDLMELNQERVFLKLSNADKAAYFKEENVEVFRQLAKRFLHKANFCLQAQFKKQQFRLEDEIDSQDLEAFVAARFERLVENGVADADDADIAWRCPEGHDDEYKRFCDCEDVDEETLEGKKCFAPLCIKCDPQKQTFDVCKKCNTREEIEKMTTIFEGREKHARREAKLEAARESRAELVHEYNNKQADPWYASVNKQKLFEKLGVDPKSKRPYTKEEARYAAECFGPSHDTKTKIKKGALPPIPEKTIIFQREKIPMTGLDVKKRVDDNLKLAKDELDKKSPEKPDLDKVVATLDFVETLLTAGRYIVSKADFDRCNTEMQQYEDSVREKRFPPEPGAIDEPEVIYGSGCEDDEEEEDGNDEHDLLNEKLKEQDELDLMKLLESSDDEM